MLTFAEKTWGNCNEAVAYQLNFVTYCMLRGDEWTNSFASSTWHNIHFDKQIKPYKYPKGKIPKKDYYRLMGYHCAVSEKMKNDMVEFGVDECNFLPILNKQDNTKILGYSILPKNILPPIYKFNWMKKTRYCDVCGISSYEYIGNAQMLEAYNGNGYPVYIDESVLNSMSLINQAFESETDIIINLTLYNFLIKKYPRLECRPVFLGCLKNDPEFIRTHTKGFKSRLR